MLSFSRIIAFGLRWLALGAGVFAVISGAVAVLKPSMHPGAGPAAIAFIAALLLWAAGGALECWSTRHARRRLRAMLTAIETQDLSPAGTFLDRKESHPEKSIRIPHLATAPSSRNVE